MLITTKTHTEVNMSFKHLTLNERNKIEVLHKEGYSARAIADIIGFHHSTISRELKRCEEDYQADIANEDCKSKASNKGRKAKSRKPKETRGRFNIGTSIRKRPIKIRKRVEFGHWELDTVVSSRGKSKGCLATFAEMKSRFYIALPMKDRSKDSMLEAVKKLIYSLPPQALKSFTSDRGKEFACYKDIEEIEIDFYFADPYSAWQRGSNENSNELLREYYPKKTNLAKIKIEELIKNIVELNNRPRKYLNYQTPFDVFLDELSLI